jgi:hypothetical protein
MGRHFLKRVRIEGFRGINNEGDPLELRFDPGKVNSVFAVNGTGKSSIFEALAYAIRGTVPKLDELSAAEKPEKYYVNKFHGGALATIELEFVSDDTVAQSTVIIVTRDEAGTRTVASPSGNSDPEGFLASLDEAFALLDYQDFSRFIDESPLNRGRSFSALLGLSEYSDLRQSLRSAADTRALDTDLELNILAVRAQGFEQSATTALGRLQTSFQQLVGIALTDLGDLDSYAVQARDALAGVPLIAEKVGTSLGETDFDDIFASIRTAEGGKERLELSALIQDVQALTALARSDSPQLGLDSVKTGVEELNTLLEQTRGGHSKHLYDAASIVLNSNEWTSPDICPLCESHLDRTIDQIVDEQIQRYSAVTLKITEIQTLWSASPIPPWLRRLEDSNLLDVEDKVSGVLSGKVADGTLSLGDVERAEARVEELAKKREDLLATKSNRRADLEKSLPPSLVRLTEQVEAGRLFNAALDDYTTSTAAYDTTSRTLDLRQRWAAFITTVAKDFAEAETKMTSAKIAGISATYKSMFENLMFAKDIIPELKRHDQREDLHVHLSDFHGLHNVSARALLSESYRNALAISVFLAAALQHQGAPRFIVLDDVTSSFDSGHQLNLMELIRTRLQYGAASDGLQFVVFSHDGQLEKYFDRLDGEGDWTHQRLQGSPPLGNVMSQNQDGNRLRKTATDFLDAGQVREAQPLMRQYLEFKLLQVIRKVSIPVPIDFAMKDHMRMVSNCLDAISSAIDMTDKAGLLILEAPQLSAIRTTYVPAIVGNWVNHYETASGASLSPAMLKSVLQAIDEFCECFKWDEVQTDGSTKQLWYKSLSKKK